MPAHPDLSPPRACLDDLRLWQQHGRLRALDVAFARFLAEQAPDAHDLLLIAAALLSSQLSRGHVCLDTSDHNNFAALLHLPDDAPPIPSIITLRRAKRQQWKQALQHPTLVSSGAGNTPLVLSGPLLYMRRYWQYERDIEQAITARLALNVAPPARAVRRVLDTLFPPDNAAAGQPDWQKIACALAARSAFSVITGGPGTGKTTTVVRLLALLQSLASAPENASSLRIHLAAPTGKAAARLNESIANAVAQLPQGSTEHIPTRVTTLHRLLGTRPDSRRFRHNAQNPLALDVLVVDEASMIDLELMAAVCNALPAHARLVLLGDSDQLASVEAGGVLGALCASAREGRWRPDTLTWLQQASGQTVDARFHDASGPVLNQAITMLRHSHRFDSGSGIGQLAQAVNAGEGETARRILHAAPDALHLLAITADAHHFHGDLTALDALVSGTEGDEHSQGYRHYLDVMHHTAPAPDSSQGDLDWWASEVLCACGHFQLLCALRTGPWGVDGLNRHITATLNAAGLIRANAPWYAGRPVLITRNDYSLGLMNGDIGITLALPGSQGALRVVFAGDDGRVRWISPARLHSVQTVFALTVHKSQGSEFSHTALLLPPQASAGVLTRELIYTAITRARKRLTLITTDGDTHVLENAIARRVERTGGLMRSDGAVPSPP